MKITRNLTIYGIDGDRELKSINLNDIWENFPLAYFHSQLKTTQFDKREDPHLVYGTYILSPNFVNLLGEHIVGLKYEPEYEYVLEFDYVIVHNRNIDIPSTSAWYEITLSNDSVVLIDDIQQYIKENYSLHNFLFGKKEILGIKKILSVSNEGGNPYEIIEKIL
jgi:hypothetical protein